MIEILVLYFLCKRMGNNLRAKGWTRTVWMQVGVVFAWLGGMFFSSLIYTFYIGLTSSEVGLESRVLSAYPFFLLAGAVAVGFVFLLASFFPSRPPFYSSDLIENATAAELATAIQAVMHGEIYLNPRVSERVIRNYFERTDRQSRSNDSHHANGRSCN